MANVENVYIEPSIINVITIGVVVFILWAAIGAVLASVHTYQKEKTA